MSTLVPDKPKRIATSLRALATHEFFPEFSVKARRFLYNPLGVLLLAAVAAAALWVLPARARVHPRGRNRGGHLAGTCAGRWRLYGDWPARSFLIGHTPKKVKKSSRGSHSATECQSPRGDSPCAVGSVMRHPKRWPGYLPRRRGE